MASILAYFGRMGWFVLEGKAIHPSADPGHLCVCSVDDDGEPEWCPFENAGALIRRWEHDARVHLRKAWTGDVIKVLFERSPDEARTSIRRWIATGGRFPDVILEATSNWQCPADWAEQVVRLGLPRMDLLGGDGEGEVVRQKLAAWLVRYDHAALSQRLPSAGQAFIRRRRL